MELAPDLGAIGFIFHPGIHGGVGYQAALPRAEEVIEVVLDTASEGAVLAMEYMDGSGPAYLNEVRRIGRYTGRGGLSRP